MIYKLKGIIDTIGEDYAVIDVGGICYRLSCSAKTLSKLPPIGEKTTMLTELQIKDDQIILIGFLSELERNSYKILITVQGVGSKVAMAILGIFTPDELSEAIIAQDKTTITRTPGVGSRVANRIITELKDRFYSSVIANNRIGNILRTKDTNPQGSIDTPNQTVQEVNDALSALSNLGYSRTQALNAIISAKNKLPQDQAISTALLIKEALKELSNE